MTELETLNRARMYLEKLANGVNPLDGTTVPEDDVIHQVRISRCLFYVADVLRQVIENGGVHPQEKMKKAPFSLPLEQRAAFAFSSVPIPISEVTKRINDLNANADVEKLSYRTIGDWLLSIGMLEKELNGDGKTVKRPTPQGRQIGISLDARMGQNGAYFVVVYDVTAQHFLLDNLDAVIAFENAKMENQGQPWLPEQDKCLIDLYQKNVPIKEIALALKRNSGAVRSRLKKLGLYTKE